MCGPVAAGRFSMHPHFDGTEDWIFWCGKRLTVDEIKDEGFERISRSQFDIILIQICRAIKFFFYHQYILYN